MIHNSGVTIPASRLVALFDPMKGRQAAGKSPPPSGPVSGLGLGLYIADRIVAAHGGRIDVESSDQRGTTFTVRLPRRKDETPGGSSSERSTKLVNGPDEISSEH